MYFEIDAIIIKRYIALNNDNKMQGAGEKSKYYLPYLNFN